VADVVSPAVRSRMMSSIRGKDTQPELIVRKYLHGCGFRYRLHVNSLPGRPDIVLPKHRVAILIHGCFWHRHSNCKYCTMPRSNVSKWVEKFSANVARDKRDVKRLRASNWRVIIIWECGVKQSDRGAGLSWLPDAITGAREPLLEWPARL